jgi:class 3 adenylate cyclase
MIYNNYSNRISNILSKSAAKNIVNKSLTADKVSGISDSQRKVLLKEQKDFAAHSQLNLEAMESMLTAVELEKATIGIHPDFAYLKFSENIAYHYIVSMFVDIQGSTSLFRDYELEEIFEITNTVQSAVIHTCLALGGYVQRLQGDGVFAYFGGKSMTKEKAVERAMIAGSMISYFVKNDLRNVFLQNGIEDINTRIGVDFGDDAKVLWANFGVAGVSELTTLSLHTSLASKMQTFAHTNGIVAGQNIKDLLKKGEEYFSVIKNSKGEEVKRYIYEDVKKGFRYAQYEFDWFSFLKSQPFVKIDALGNLYLAKPTPIASALPSPIKDYNALAAMARPNKPHSN